MYCKVCAETEGLLHKIERQVEFCAGNRHYLHKAGEKQARRGKARSLGGVGDDWDDCSVLGHLFRFLVSLRPFVKLKIYREDEG